MFVAKTKNYFIACNFQRTSNFNHALRFQTKIDAEQAIRLMNKFNKQARRFRKSPFKKLTKSL